MHSNVFLMGLIRNRLGIRHILSLGNVKTVGLGLPSRRNKTNVNAKTSTFKYFEANFSLEDELLAA